MIKIKDVNLNLLPLLLIAGSLLLGGVLAGPIRSGTDADLLDSSSEQFNIFCDYNGGGTGDCNRLDNNEVINCAFASQDFIQCRSKKGYLATCLYFAPNQFACRRIRDVRLNPQGRCENPLDASSTCRPPIREKFSNPLTPSPQPSDSSGPQPNPLQSPMQDTFRNTF